MKELFIILIIAAIAGMPSMTIYNLPRVHNKHYSSLFYLSDVLISLGIVFDKTVTSDYSNLLEVSTCHYNAFYLGDTHK